MVGSECLERRSGCDVSGSWFKWSILSGVGGGECLEESVKRPVGSW